MAFLLFYNFRLILGGIIIAFSLKRRNLSSIKSNQRTFIGLFILTMIGVLPIMITLKQRSFYILTVYPLFAIAWAYYLLPLLDKFTNNSKPTLFLKSSAISLLLLALGLNTYHFGEIGRDHQMIEDVDIILSLTNEKKLSVCQGLKYSWSLHGYFMRRGGVSLDPSGDNQKTYKVFSNSCLNKKSTKGYKKITSETKYFHLYQLIQQN